MKMLFVDNGKGPVRVKCSDPVLGGMLARAAKAKANRWWLVECSTVRDGKALVTGNDEGYQGAGGFLSILGKVLDSSEAEAERNARHEALMASVRNPTS